jgi:sugar lactone lactonase YvrE
VWVGAWNERRYYQLDASNGNLLQTVNVPHNPYGAVMDRFGTLWSMDLGSSNAQTGDPEGLVRITSATGQAQGPIRVRSTSGCAGGYGITVDGADNVWIGGFGCEAVYRYTPSTDSWFTVRMPANTGWTRGIAADRDGWIYVGSSNLLNNNQTSVGHITRFRQEDGSQLRVFDYTNRSRGTIGVGLDNQGRVWGVNGDSSNATRLDPSTGQTEHFPVGTGPYTYSDFTGYTLRNFTAPQGTYRSLFRGCPDKDRAMWRDISWEGDEPVGTDISVRVKSAFTLDELVTAPYYGPYSDNPTDLDAAQVPDGKFLEVEVTMTTDTPGVSPILWNLSVTWNCPPIL